MIQVKPTAPEVEIVKVPEQPDPVQRVAERCVEFLRTHLWIRGAVQRVRTRLTKVPEDPTQMYGYCALGVMGMVISGSAESGAWSTAGPGRELQKRFERLVAYDVASWNDKTGRRKSEVIDVFKKIAEGGGKQQ